MNTRTLSYLSLAIVAGVASLQASAATRCVNPGGTGGCFATLTAAIGASAATGDSINVAPGTYFERNIQVDRSVDISGAGVDTTIIDGGISAGNGPSDVLRYPDFSFPVTMTLSNLTVQHGSRGMNIGGANNVTLDHVRVTANGPASGAGVYNGSSNLYVNHSTIDGNSATDIGSLNGCDWGGGSGGGIASLCGGGSNFISNSTISGNTASRWGGGLIVNDGVTVIENSTISGNHANFPDAGIGGGAMFLAGGSPDVTIRFSTIANNTAVGVGGIWGYTAGDAHVKVFATILQDNTGTNCRIDSGAASEPITSLGYNVASDASCPFTQATDLTSTDAMTGPLLDNGGPTDTHALFATSPALDRVPAASCTVALDQRGTSRPQRATCDVGAFELVRPIVPPLLSAHADVTAELTNINGAFVSYVLPTATAGELPVASIACSPVSGSSFLLGSHTISCTATDTGGNSGHSSFKVRVVDTTPPVVTSSPGISVLLASPAGTQVTYTARASDLSEGPFSVPVTCAPASGSFFMTGDTTVTCSATDRSGNTGLYRFTVHVAGVQEQIANLLATVSILSDPALRNIVAGVLARVAGRAPLQACQNLSLVAEIAVQTTRIPPALRASIALSTSQIRAALGCSP